MSSTPQGGPRKVYQRPCLKVYGHLQDVTKTVGNVSTNMDGGVAGMSKTH